jgi:TonB family protein
MRLSTALFTSALALIIFSSSCLADPQKGDADYPLEALAKHQQGSVVVDLIVGADGSVKDCAVLVTSNSPTLDEQTCLIFKKQARFTPKRNVQGELEESHAMGRVNWVIPRCAAPKQFDPRLRQGVDAEATITSLEHC